jgi:hypothetical protein
MQTAVTKKRETRKRGFSLALPVTKCPVCPIHWHPWAQSYCLIRKPPKALVSQALWPATDTNYHHHDDNIEPKASVRT